jgi:hypothetical protein
VIFTGSVTNASGELVAGAELYLMPKVEGPLAEVVRRAFESESTHSIITTDDMGAFRVNIPGDRSFYAGIMLQGEPQELVQEVAAVEGETEVKAVFTLPRAYEVLGQVTDETSTRQPGIPVLARWIVPSLRSGEPREMAESVDTDSEGRYRFEIPALSVAWMAIDRENLPSPYLYERDDLKLTPADFRESRSYRHDFALVTGVPVEGEVMEIAAEGERGDAIQNARVRLRELLPVGETRPMAEFTAMTDDLGFFSFPFVAPREYLLTVEHPEYSPRELRDYRPAEQTDMLRVELSPLAVVTGTIAGSAASRGTVRLIDRYTEKLAAAERNDDAQLSFRLPDVRSGTYLLVAETREGGGISYGEKRVAVGDAPTTDLGEVTVRPLTEIRGEFTGAPAGFDPRTVLVEARPMADDSGQFIDTFPSKGRRLPISSTSDSGSFAIENTAKGDPYKVVAIHRQSGEVLGSALAEAGDGKPVRIALGGVGSVRGSVRGKQNQACVGSEVELVTGLGSLDGQRGVLQTWRTFVNYEGNYSFEGVPAGQARLTIIGEQDSNRLINVPRGSAITINLNCRTYVEVVLELVPGAETRFQPREQFVVVAKPGYDVKQRVHELTLEKLSVPLEPARYMITRTSTMETREFEVNPNSTGMIRIDFSSAQQEASAP